MPSILIVEDDIDIAEAIGEHLASAGHRVRIAYNGAEGLRKVADELPDLILLDVEMPVLDGPGMAESLATERAGQVQIAVVLISAATTLESLARSIGTPYYLRKPFRTERLVALVDQVLYR